MLNIDKEKIEKVKSTAWSITKYGLVFCSGVLVGTVVGVVLVFTIDHD